MTTVKSDELMKSVARIAYPDYNGRKYRVVTQTYPLDVRSYWEGGSRNYFVFVDMRQYPTVKVLPVPQQSMFDRQIENADRAMLPDGFVCVEHVIFCGHDLGLVFHVTPNDSSKMLESGDKPALNDLQTAFIRLWGGLTSAGRKDEASSYHIPQWLIEVLAHELVDLGLMTVNKVGAVSLTLEGKQYRESFGYADSHSFWWAWRDSWRMSDTDYKYRPLQDGVARHWLDEYRDKRPIKA